MKNNLSKHIVIIGGGFGGLNAAIKLAKAGVKITLIDKRNFHLFQPLLYQVASGGLSPADIAFPLRAVFKNKNNVSIIQGEVTDIDLDKKNVVLNEKRILFDYLIIAAGSQIHYYGNDQWKHSAIGLKYIEDATKIRNNILNAFEQAEIENDIAKKTSLLTFAIIGGGPAGVEMSGAIAELANRTLHCDFRNIDPTKARIILIEGGSRILPVYPTELSLKAEDSLKKLGVEIIKNHFVKNIEDGKIFLESNSQSVIISSSTIIWAAGVKANSLSKIIKGINNILLDKSGRIVVDNYCRVINYKNIFAIGDIASFNVNDSQTLPGVAPVAIQQGKFVAKYIINDINGFTNQSFNYFEKGNLAVIGRKAAVAFRGKIKFSGLIAWLVWLFVHLLYLVGFQNRVLVSIQWAFNYFSLNKSARLIANSVDSDNQK